MNQNNNTKVVKKDETTLNNLFKSFDGVYKEQAQKIEAPVKKADIKMINGKWTLNGKTYDEMNFDERGFIDDMFRTLKFEAITLFH